MIDNLDSNDRNIEQVQSKIMIQSQDKKAFDWKMQNLKENLNRENFKVSQKIDNNQNNEEDGRDKFLIERTKG